MLSVIGIGIGLEAQKLIGIGIGVKKLLSCITTCESVIRPVVLKL